MARLYSLSLFTRLYLTIALAVIVSGTVSFFFIEKLNKQNEIDEYVIFTDYVYQGLLKQGKITANAELSSITKEKNYLDDFAMSWQVMLEKSSPCDDCQLIGHSGNVDLYSNFYNQFFAVYKLTKVKAWLVISEDDVIFFGDEGEDDLSAIEPLDEDVVKEWTLDDITPMILLFIVLTTIATAIYWPIRAIQRQIESLITTQHQFGVGDMHARANKEFTKPLNELAVSFNFMASAITDTVNENQVFAQAVPHEIPTPLSRIQLAVGLLSRNNDNKQQMELLGNIDTYIGDINELISQVVEFSKLNAVNDECEFSLHQSIELSEFIESRIKATKCEDKLKVIRHLNTSLEFTTNPVYLRLLMDNLLKNACIHGKNQIVVSLNSSNGHIELSIEDDGDGIPIEFIDTIFIPFSRLDVSRSRKTGGLGLGLAISKAACKRMNSHLTVENSATAGAKFTCLFFDGT
jgi:signal transduction histidine kinase